METIHPVELPPEIASCIIRGEALPTDDFEPLRSDQRLEDLEVATNAVASTLELLARVPTASMVHDEMDEVLGMLARVLRNPGILT